MAKRREPSSEDRRNQLAQEAGWNSRAQERYAKEKFAQSSLDVQGKWGRFLFNHPDLSKTEERRAFRAYWQGLVDPRTREDTDKNSAKAEWFVEWLDVVDDYELWEEMYGDD